MNTQNKIVYFDNAATTSVLPEALEKYIEISRLNFGNPSSTHLLGRKALECFEDCQERIARIFNVIPNNVIFTSGGTESNNLAIWGSLGGIEQEISQLISHNEGQILTTVNEHDATKKTIEALQHLKAPVTFLKVDSEGFLDPTHFNQSLEKRVRLLSIHHAQNEVGTLQDLKSISKNLKSFHPNALIHTDAVQSFLKVPFSMTELGVDLVSISGHKIGAPKGIGAIILGEKFNNRKPKLGNLIFGSSQQSGVRPGTIPVPLIASFTTAIEWGHFNLSKNQNHLIMLRKQLIEGLPKKVEINGPKDPLNNTSKRSPQTLNFSIPGFPSGMMVEALSSKGICISAGSACHSTNAKPNETILNMGHSKERAMSSIRVSLSHHNTKEEINYFNETLNCILEKYC